MRDTTGGVLSHPLVVPNGIVHFEFFRLGKSCQSPTALRVVGTGITRSYKLHEGNRFVLIVTIKNI